MRKVSYHNMHIFSIHYFGTVYETGLSKLKQYIHVSMGCVVFYCIIDVYLGPIVFRHTFIKYIFNIGLC